MRNKKDFANVFYFQWMMKLSKHFFTFVTDLVRPKMILLIFHFIQLKTRLS
jgi:hypothetical protein